MSNQYPGGLITKTPVVPTSLVAPGIWTLSQQAAAQATNTWPFTRDPQFNYVTMLLHGDGSAGPVAMGSGAGTSSTVTNFNADASTNNFNVTINGDARSNNFTPYQGVGYYSNNFSSSSTDYLSAASNAAFAFGTGDFTMEAFVFATASQTDNWIIGLANNCWFRVGSGGALEFYNSVASTSTLASTALPLNTWTHVAVVRSGTALTIYQNGVSVGSATVSTNFSSSVACTIGNQVGYDRRFNGYISNARVVKGTAVYTSAFTPSTTPLTAISGTSLLTCQNNRFIDNSVNAFTITVNGTPQVAPAQPFTLPSSVATYGSGFFDGTGDSLSLASSSTALPTGTQDFSVEMYLYWQTQGGSYPQLISNPTTNGFQIYYDVSAGALAVGIFNVSNIITYTIAQTALSGRWTHLVVTRSGNTFRLFVNGVLQSNGTNTISFASLTTQYIASDGSRPYTGYMTDVRTVLGAIPTSYQTSSTTNGTSVFTPPTAPLTAVSSTALLTTQYNGGGNNSGFKDSSQFNFPITRNGNTTQGTFTPYGSNWSNYFNGSSSLSCNVSGISAGTSTFTFEAWVFLTSMAGDSILFDTRSSNGVSTTGMDVAVYSSGNMKFYDGTETNLGGTVTANVWTHIALVRNSSNVVTAYINGTATGTTVSSTRNFSDNYFWIASVPGPVAPYLNGYMSNLRWVVGTAVYTSNFTPSTTPLTAITNTKLLTCQSNRFVDNSTNAYTITVNSTPSVQRFSPFAPLTVYNPATYGGSLYGDGTGDYLSAGTNTAFAVGTGDFTIEFWVYPIAFSGTYTGYFTTRVGGQGFDIQILNSSATLMLGDNAGAVVSANNVVSLNNWQHICAVRSGSTNSLYVNGTRVATGTASTNFTDNGAKIFSSGPSGTNNATGFMTDVRLVKGTAVYSPSSSTLTVPTAPLTAITNTSLLLNATNAGILDNAMMNDLETVGNAQISTSVVKYGTASMYFDGTGDYLVPNAPSSNVTLGLGSGDFTVEFWVYFISGLGSDILLYDGRPLSTNGAYPTIYVNASSQLSYVVSSSDRITSGSAFSTLTWYHVAVARSGTSTKMFVNGTQVGSTYTDTTTYLSAARRPTIAINGFNETAAPLNGYLDDLRVTRGFCRYTTTFTPPTQAFPNG